MTLVRWNPYNELQRIQEEMDRLFENSFTGNGRKEGLMRFATELLCNFHEDGNNYVIDAEMPGMKKGDIKVTLKDNILTLSGEKKEENEKKDKHMHVKERLYGSFSRSFVLPDGVKEGKIDASYKDGILKVVLPKSEKKNAKEISVK